jgi:LPS-assembly lipoprotein
MKLLLTLTLAGLLCACGFHLRGSYEVPAFMQHVGVQTPAGNPLRGDLLLTMETVGIDSNGGALTLVIEHAKLITQTSALVTQTEVSEVTLVYDVQYRLRYADGRAATEVRNLLLRRSYQNDPTSIVGKTTEADTLTGELRSDAAQQIVRQLSALRDDKLLPDVDPGMEADAVAASGAASGPEPAATSAAPAP